MYGKSFNQSAIGTFGPKVSMEGKCITVRGQDIVKRKVPGESIAKSFTIWLPSTVSTQP